ncbi:phosphotransferase [Erythrobacteraceae bacterium WH01K]|nr:phosphotransferase [Erythrobacteraceae bacterium WH01K]
MRPLPPMGDRDSDLAEGLARVAARAGLGPPGPLKRLTGGATMESWRFDAGEESYVLRRSPSEAFMADRPFGHDVEAAVIRAAHAGGVSAPEVVAELEPADGIGSGFVMRALPGTPDPKVILATGEAGRLLAECAAQLARIHALPATAIPGSVPTLDPREGIAAFREQFEAAGGDRPVIALGIRWLMDNVPPPVEPVLNHGDYRVGNLLVEDGWLTGVLDWELAHWSDWHEDLAFGCMAVWRFSRYEREALGLGSIEEYCDAYEANGGRAVDPGRFRFWMVYRTVWWALGCLRMGETWRSGADRTLERAVISRRTSEQELDLLMLLESEADESERAHRVEHPGYKPLPEGEAGFGELAAAISEWLVSIKDRMEGHDRFQLAVARNALGMIEREESMAAPHDLDRDLAQRLLAGERSLSTPSLLWHLRSVALAKAEVDAPRYPALAVARKKWTGED